MKLFSSKRRLTAALVIVVALFLIRPGASRLKSRIIRSISAGVGRPVDIGAVHIRLLPRPGFDLKNLVVYDDPSFGAEPILRASEVTANLRLMSLARGRLEVAWLDLTEPSLNLAHRADGRWNLEALLERSAHIPLAPTAKGKSEPRPGFPYIEGSSGRINFKEGAEKKPYALANADFALWQDSENAWGVRLKAQPIRSDLNLNDTGQLQVNGTWRRAALWRDTPLNFSIEWSHAQLGQLSKFLAGTDQGWRGAIQLNAALAGTPAQLRIASEASVDDFRRYDITSGRALRLAANCDAEYSTVTHDFHHVICNAPVASGEITLSGDLGLPGSHRYSIAITAERIPASAVAALVQHSKKNLPDDVLAEGTISGSVSMQEDAASGAQRQFEGRGEIAEFHLSSAADKAEIGPETIPFIFVSNASSGRKPWTGGRSEIRFPDEPHVEIGPLVMGVGRPGAPVARGWISRAGYEFRVAGEAEVEKALHVARALGVPASPATVEGSAQLDLQIAGAWAGDNRANAGFIGPQVTGTAKLRNIRIGVRGAETPVAIASAEMQLLPDKVRVVAVNATAGGSTWTGWVETPRGCGTAETCPARFFLNANQLSLSQLHQWITPKSKPRAWYQVLEQGSGATPVSSLLANLNASGHVTAESLHAHGIVATHVSADVAFKKAVLIISGLKADIFDGEYDGEWQADFSVKPGVCKGSGNFSGLSLASIATAMNDPWIAGQVSGDYEVKGPCPTDFWHSAEGTLRLDMRDGTFSHVIVGDGTEALRVNRLSGQAQLRAGKVEISDIKLDSPDGKYILSGTASLKRDVDVKLTRASGGIPSAGYAITGTVAAPHVAPLAGAEQARLKPKSVLTQ